MQIEHPAIETSEAPDDISRISTNLSLVLLIIFRITSQLLLYRSGFAALAADEFGRTINAARWAHNPIAIWDGVWLPFHRYILGTALWLKWDLLYVPRVMVGIIGIGSILVSYQLGSTLFKNRRIGLLTALLITINPLHIWLSSTPLTAISHATFSLGAIWFLILYLENKQPQNIYYGAISMAVATGFRFESWIIAVLFCSTLITLCINQYRQSNLNQRQLRALLFGILVPTLFPTIWIVSGYVKSGDVFGFISSIRTYKSDFYGQNTNYQNYLDTFLQIDPYTTVAGIFALLLCVMMYRHSLAVRAYALFATIPLISFILLHGGQIEPQGNYFRYLAFFVFIAYPAVAFFINLSIEHLPQKTKSLKIITFTVIIGVIGTTQFQSAFQFRNDPSSMGLSVGQHIRELRSANPSIAHQPILLELSYWEYLAVHIGANDINGIIYDRALDLEKRESISFLETDSSAIESCLAQHQISYIVVKSPALRNLVEKELRIEPEGIVNDYAFYSPTDQLPANLNPNSEICPLQLY